MPLDTRAKRNWWVRSQGANDGMTRSCQTCRWFRPDGDGQAGRCTNQELELELGFQAAVRGKELHCRRGWSDDKWTATSEDIVLEIRVKTPLTDRDSSRREETGQVRANGFRSVESVVSSWDAAVVRPVNVDPPHPE